jgi:Fe2+ or Zn2+ uptake regulation protein
MKRTDSLYNRLATQFTDYMREAGKRCTVERLMILRYCCNQKKRITYSYLKDCAQKDHICLQTLYNTMELLAEANVVVREVDNGTPNASFALQLEKRNTIRMICTKCHRVEEFKDKVVLERLRMRKYNNFNMLYYTAIVYGQCKECNKLKNHGTNNDDGEQPVLDTVYRDSLGELDCKLDS